MLSSSGYCETGHELFDDDLLDDDGYAGAGPNKRKGKGGKPSKKLSKEERQTEKANFLSVRDMLTNMPAKRKREVEESANVPGADDLLKEMMLELSEDTKTKKIKPDQKSGMKLLSVLTNANMPSSSKRRRDDDAEAAKKLEEECMSIIEKTSATSISKRNARPSYREVKIEPVYEATLDDCEPLCEYEDTPSFSNEGPSTTKGKVEPEVKAEPVKDTSTLSSKKRLQALEESNKEFMTRVDVDVCPSKGHLIVEEETKVEFMTSDGSGDNQVCTIINRGTNIMCSLIIYGVMINRL